MPYSSYSEITRSPYRKLQELGPDAVRWTRGFWADKFDLCHAATIESTWDAMHDRRNSACFDNLYVAAGLKDAPFVGTDWGDGDCYKWMEAASHLWGVTTDPALERRLDELIEVVGKAQDPDGYINTQIQLTGKQRWSRRRHHEDYNFGHLFTSASVHYRVTGKRSFLDIALKAADYLYSLFAPTPPRELVHFGWNPSQIMGLVDLYRDTGDRRYLELADIFMTMRGSHPEDITAVPDMVPVDPGDQNQDRVPLRKETMAVGHCVTATYLYAGAADIFMETGEQAIWDGLMRIWQDATEHKTYITGGSAALYHGTSKRRDDVHEAYGLEYQLPNSNAYNETCATIGNAMWNWRLLNISGEARFADAMEQVIYNGGLSPVSLDGRRFFYCNPLRYTGSEYHLTRKDDIPERWQLHGCYCCPPQVARSLAWMKDWAYSLADDGLWVHIYGGNALQTRLADGSPLALSQESDYPWDGQIRLTIAEAPARPFAVHLRIPSWIASQADDVTVRVNGEPVAARPQPGSYFEVRRTWSAGDTIELVLPLAVQLVEAHPLVEEARNQVAVMRGPVVYCLETVDTPGVALSEVYLPSDVNLAPVRGADLLDGLTVLQGEACRIPAGDWSGRLYRPAGHKAAEKLPITLIPYHAWTNRGPTEMSIWLPMC